jgi:hypothetical protein
MPMAADRPGCRRPTRSGDDKTPMHSHSALSALFPVITRPAKPSCMSFSTPEQRSRPPPGYTALAARSSETTSQLVVYLKRSKRASNYVALLGIRRIQTGSRSDHVLRPSTHRPDRDRGDECAATRRPAGRVGDAVTLPGHLLQLSERTRGSAEPMAMFVGRGRRMPTRQRWEQIFDAAHLRAVGLSEEHRVGIVMPREVRIHDTRHTFAPPGAFSTVSFTAAANQPTTLRETAPTLASASGCRHQAESSHWSRSASSEVSDWGGAAGVSGCSVQTTLPLSG